MLHRPLEHATPSQRLAMLARHRFHASIAAKAKPDAGIILNVPQVTEPGPPEPLPDTQWAERQKMLHPTITFPLKKMWFYIDDDVPEPNRPTVVQIQNAVCKAYHVGRGEMISSQRHAQIVFPRQVAMYLCKALTLRTLPELGRLFGNRDHTTALHSIRKIEKLIETDNALAAIVAGIRAELCA